MNVLKFKADNMNIDVRMEFSNFQQPDCNLATKYATQKGGGFTAKSSLPQATGYMSVRAAHDKQRLMISTD